MINKRLLSEGKNKYLYIPVNIAAALLNAAFIVINAYLLAKIVDAVFIKKQTFDFLVNYIILFITNAAAKTLSNLLIESTVKNMSEDIKEEIRERVFVKILSSNPLKVKEKKVGEIVNTLTEGVEMITPYYHQYIPQLFASVLVPTLICISAFFIDPLSALIMLVTYPIIPIFMMLIGCKSKEVNEKQWKKLSTLSSHLLDMLQGLRTLKVFGRDKVQEEKVYEVSENYRKSTMEVLRISFFSALVLETAATISTAVIAVNLGLRLVYDKISFFNAFFILILTPDFYVPLRQLGLKFHASLNGQVAIEKLDSLEQSLGSEENNENSNAVKGPISIEVKNLSFSHEEKEALKHISFSIRAGEKIALVGESGSGKSTLINIICGLLEAERGTVFINSKDIRDLDKKSYLENIAIVPQHPHIFNRSLEENITLESKYNENLSLRELYRQTRIDSFAEELKDKYNTIIGEGEAVAVSGGESQRIALARAVYKGADFIVMDEPTSALDADTEEIVGELLKGDFKNKTVLISAHRLNTLKNADRILVLKEGALVEEGTHDKLLLKKGYYYNLLKAGEKLEYI